MSLARLKSSIPTIDVKARQNREILRAFLSFRAEGLSNSPPPRRGVPAGVEHRDDHDGLRIDQVEDSVRKTPDKRTAHFTFGARELLRHPAHRLDRGLHAGHELLAEAGGARLVPSLCLGELLLGLRPEDDLAGQRARARAST